MFSKMWTKLFTPNCSEHSTKQDNASQLEAVRNLIRSADKIVVGAGSGLSTAAGLRHDGPQFEQEFADFIRAYGFTDLYSSSFYPFPTTEQYWACWARHIQFIRYNPPAMPLYRQLLNSLATKDYFVITTNVDAQFKKAGCDLERLFEVQGDYGLLQCSKRCHDTLYDNERLVAQMVAQTHDLQIPSHLVPVCPRCGESMAVHVRVDNYFVEDEQWHMAQQRYDDFVASTQGKQTVLLELGVGFNTPSIIRFPFEKMAQMFDNFTLVRINKDNTNCIFNVKHSILINDDITSLDFT